MIRGTATRIVMFAAVAMLATAATGAGKAPTGAATAQWDGVARVVAVGDVHGDYDAFIAVLRDSGLIDKRLRWAGGDTHLVQTGDIPDRGPDTRKILDFLMKLERQAAKKGGAVHVLIGNHEAMNLSGDLRYVHPGEYAAFRDRSSRRRQQAYYDQTVAHIQANQPEELWPAFDEAWRSEWEERHPEGYVEHRLAWAPTGKYGEWVAGHNAIIRINDSLFLHAGLDPDRPAVPISDINTRVRTELIASEQAGDDALMNAPDGPLWYRGLSTLAETPENLTRIEALLDAYGVARIVVGHTPLVGAVVPRFGGRVLINDVGLSAYYGGANACVIIEDGVVTALQNGIRFELPDTTGGREAAVAYLEKIAMQVADPPRIEAYIEKLLRRPEEPPGGVEVAETEPATELSRDTAE